MAVKHASEEVMSHDLPQVGPVRKGRACSLACILGDAGGDGDSSFHFLLVAT